MILFLLLLLASCSSSNTEDPFQLPMKLIKGRDNDRSPFPVYRVRVPGEWIRRDPLPDEPMTDTTQPLVEFIIRDTEGTIRIWVHNFPYDSREQSIPPIAQKERWQRQFEILYPHETESIPIGFNGYTGVAFLAKGSAGGTEKAVLAWALQIPPQHYETLSHPKNAEEATQFKQMRADVTIKAEGPIPAIERHREEIGAFARSFELIDEIPDRW